MNGQFQENFYHKFKATNVKTILKGVDYVNDVLLISFGYYLEKYSNTTFDNKIRLLNMKSGKLSSSKVLFSNKLKEPDVLSGKAEIKAYQKKDKSIYSNSIIEYFSSIKNTGFLASKGSYGLYSGIDFSSPFIIMPNGEVSWEIETKNRSLLDNSFLFGSDEEVLLFASKKAGEDVMQSLNTINGKVLFSKTYKSDKYAYRLLYSKIDEGEIITIGKIYIIGDLGRQKSLGLYKRVIHKRTGKELTLDYFKFSDLTKLFDISEYGEIDKKGYLDFQTFNITPKGDVLAIAETYKLRTKNNI